MNDIPIEQKRDPFNVSLETSWPTSTSICCSPLSSPTRAFGGSPAALVMDATALICSMRGCHAASWASAEGSRGRSDSNCFPSGTMATYYRMSVRSAVSPPQGFATRLVGRLLFEVLALGRHHGCSIEKTKRNTVCGILRQ